MSARENLTLGRSDATEEEVAEALEVAQAGFVHDLPWGLDTRIGEQGMSLSGGQRQRLALARAVLARPRVLVLDDTLSALDVHTEELVEEALRLVLARPPASSWPTAPRRCCWPTGSRCSRTARSPTSATHSELLATVPAYRELLAADAERRARPATAPRGQATPDPRPRAPDWRGVAAEATPRRSTEDESPALLRRRGSRRLLGELLRAAQADPWLAAWSIVLVENAARLSIPYLVKEGIDNGIPPIRASAATRRRCSTSSASCWSPRSSRRSPG